MTEKDAKVEAIRDWCECISENTGRAWQYVRVNQTEFCNGQFPSFRNLLASIGGSGKLSI